MMKDVENVVKNVMNRIPDVQPVDFTIDIIDGPVRYDSSWTPGGRKNSLRHGLESMELWTGHVVWKRADRSRSFTVIVKDYEFVTKRRSGNPLFETFVLAVLNRDISVVNNVYELFTDACPCWQDRGSWLKPLGKDSDDRSDAARDAHRKSCWQGLSWSHLGLSYGRKHAYGHKAQADIFDHRAMNLKPCERYIGAIMGTQVTTT